MVSLSKFVKNEKIKTKANLEKHERNKGELLQYTTGLKEKLQKENDRFLAELKTCFHAK